MDNSEKKTGARQDGPDDIKDIVKTRAALRLALAESASAEEDVKLLKKAQEAADNEIVSLKQELAKRAAGLEEWRRKTLEIEKQLFRSVKHATEAEEKARKAEEERCACAVRVAELEREAVETRAARAKFSSLSSRLSEGGAISEQLAHMHDEKTAAEERARRAEQEQKACASRLQAWEHKAEELESARKSFLSLMSQLAEARKLAAEGQEALLRMRTAKEEVEARARLIGLERQTYLSKLKLYEHKAEETEGARKAFLSLTEDMAGGVGGREELRRLMEAKNSLETKSRILELEKETAVSRLREWEKTVVGLEEVRKNLETRETRIHLSEKHFTEKDAALTERAAALENEYARKHKELDDFKERLRAEVNELTGKRKDPLP